jgi:hypothetical protein
MDARNATAARDMPVGHSFKTMATMAAIVTKAMHIALAAGMSSSVVICMTMYLTPDKYFGYVLALACSLLACDSQNKQLF